MKKAKRARMLLALFLLAAIVTGIVLFLRRDTLPGWEPSEYISAAAQIRTRDEILRAAEACRDLYIGAEKLPPEYSGGDQRLRQADIDAIEERLAQVAWNRVGEELPNLDDGAVLIDGEMTAVQVLAVIEGAKASTVLYFDGEEFFDYTGDEIIPYRVTHWRPMPAVPREEDV